MTVVVLEVRHGKVRKNNNNVVYESLGGKCRDNDSS
ncbi:MAG: hypothetical protein K0R22_1095 [Sporomusa sp.]|jgi:hypothetical protein|nr:hypothetical protein [Sporomusa sp.]